LSPRIVNDCVGVANVKSFERHVEVDPHVRAVASNTVAVIADATASTGPLSMSISTAATLEVTVTGSRPVKAICPSKLPPVNANEPPPRPSPRKQAD
jgi:hypothetical protein